MMLILVHSSDCLYVLLECFVFVGGAMPVPYPPSAGYPNQPATSGGAYPRPPWMGSTQQNYPYQGGYPPYSSTQSYGAQTGETLLHIRQACVPCIQY